jgi:hypothetical protein
MHRSCRLIWVVTGVANATATDVPYQASKQS